MNEFISALNMFELLNPVPYPIASTITFIFPLEEQFYEICQLVGYGIEI